MAVITLEEFRPPRRYDDLPWTEARIEEAEDADGSWAEVETLALDPVDDDPENPAYRDLTTELATDAVNLWYRIVWVDASSDESTPTYPIQNAPPSDAYVTVDELARILKIRTPTTEQETSMARVILAASGEIDAELDRSTDGADLAGWQLALVQEVNLERAVEHWRQQESPFGLMGLGSEFGGGAERTARDSWTRHAHKLAPLKAQWGFA
jgi:hypothetical protein